MTRLFRIIPAAMACSSFLALAYPATSWAQSAREQEAQAEAEEAAQKAQAAKDAKRAAPPAAVPGANGIEDDDGEHANTDMEPTAALFEAINRGSISAAKESVNRGADLNSRNVLGQTPLEMSIDLNRNPITFLLLSLRGADDRPRTDVAAETRSMKMENGSGHLTIGGSAGRHGKNSVTRDSRYDTSGGRPQPEVGFLGFGGG
ncbi:ankyrin repeat domain-containing protein [Acetobacter indonesiensis]|jgi:ankyrin repeat protein|nr:ankyrin repeat domain-containing protein [Acetobacter indonesiensis]MCG0994141.1 ankyrin repeat domain-containing protein [Acetobacter indonesiensis]MCI1438077.1 ankyrin repeat domain-containing protein [Acetobacter indonesiensis]MCI1545148.1 ankyrin repeat domain-containing protein [Acetobacter indonesiensis]MCI1764608.1 ankyrin repeat domain-containing protein [Acetobacter indonesiensis]MCP1230528.1 ankyrin repeat domain-containing protein [Acetobacter indonesiensis]